MKAREGKEKGPWSYYSLYSHLETNKKQELKESFLIFFSNIIIPKKPLQIPQTIFFFFCFQNVFHSLKSQVKKNRKDTFN